MNRLLGWLPKGTTEVAVGILVNGLATYFFLVLPARLDRLDPERFAVFSTLWFAAYLIGPGLYVPLEQELSRLTASGAAKQRPDDVAAAARAGLVFVAITSGVIAAGLLLAIGPVSERVFSGNRLAVIVLAASVVASGTIQWAKGYLSGVQSFGRYGALVGIEGLFRAAAVAALVIAGVTAAGVYTIPVAAAPLLAVAIVLYRHAPRLAKGSASRQTTVTSATVTSAIGVLVVAQLAAQFLMNAVPLSLALLASEAEADTVGRLGAALLLARIPLFLFQAVQAAFLPNLVAMLESGDRAGFHRTVRIVVAGFVGLGIVAVGLGAALGPWLTRWMFDEAFEVTAMEFGALVLSAMVIVVGLLFAQALIALNQHRAAAKGWVVGVIAFIPVAAAGSDLVERVLLAGVVGPIAALAMLIWLFANHASQIPEPVAAQP